MIRTIGFLFVFALTLNAFANPNNRGYSGAPGSLGRCSSSCHGVNQGTVEVSGFPTQYVPDSTYLLTIEAVTGLPIKNFNGSVRVGTGSVVAGVITAGQNTATYSVAQETNGIRLSTLDRQSGTFNWTAPAAGTGTVRLYVAAHQGARNTGPNTNITIVSEEGAAPLPPDQVQLVAPDNGATNQPLSVVLQWAQANGAESYEVFFGTTGNLVSMSNTIDLSYSIDNLLPETIYQWRVDAINSVGTTTGLVWSFTTEAQSGVNDLALPAEFKLDAAYPNPFNSAVRVNLTVSSTAQVNARVFDINGRAVAELVNGSLSVGAHVLEWNASGNSAGLYFLRCDCNGLTQTQKLIFLP